MKKCEMLKEFLASIGAFLLFMGYTLSRAIIPLFLVIIMYLVLVHEGVLKLPG